MVTRVIKVTKELLVQLVIKDPRVQLARQDQLVIRVFKVLLEKKE
jgi:hypothetical protein